MIIQRDCETMISFLSPSPIFLNNGIAILRMAIGLLLFYHGIEIFTPEIMNSYLEWEMFKGPYGKFLVYMGKGSEFITGVLLFLGLFTRPAALVVIGNFCYITFFVGEGRFWYQEQHPFMFALFGVLFLFTGPGAWSLDKILFKRKV
jgi:putative oxidoreductase